MTFHNYLSKLSALSDFYERSLPAAMIQQLQLQYAFVSASLSNFLPQLPVEDHHMIYRRILLHQQLSLLDESFPRVMQHLLLEVPPGFSVLAFRRQPAIFCTFHNGSYRLINFLLKRERIPYALLAGGKILSQEKSRFEKNFSRYKVKDSFPLSFIDAEHPAAAIAMLRALRQGKSLLVYLDGNTGTGAASADNAHLCNIAFLAQRLLVRSGVAFLADRCAVPLVPVINYRTDLRHNTLRFFAPVTVPGVGQEAAALAMQQLYDHLTPLLISDPSQWEAWLYLHKYARVSPVSAITGTPRSVPAYGGFVFNSGEFATFKTGQQGFLLRKNAYASFPISENLYDLLSRAAYTGIDHTAIAPELLKQLYREGIIVKS